jgi:hypothetical protein
MSEGIRLRQCLNDRLLQGGQTCSHVAAQVHTERPTVALHQNCKIAACLRCLHDTEAIPASWYWHVGGIVTGNLQKHTTVWAAKMLAHLHGQSRSTSYRSRTVAFSCPALRVHLASATCGASSFEETPHIADESDSHFRTSGLLVFVRAAVPVVRQLIVSPDMLSWLGASSR